MIKHPLIVLAAMAATSVAACSSSAGSSTGPSRAAGTATSPTATSSPATTTPTPATATSTAAEPTNKVESFRVAYDWAAPSTRVTISHPSGAASTPTLVAVHTGDHPDGDPAYSRISFYFQGGFPGYNFNYAPGVFTEGQGDRLPLEGNAFLRIQFVHAGAHTDAGRPTVSVAPSQHVGYQNLRSYGFGGDFESYVTYGLGLQVAPSSDQILLVRTVELKKSGNTGHHLYVIAFDIQHG